MEPHQYAATTFLLTLPGSSSSWDATIFSALMDSVTLLCLPAIRPCSLLRCKISASHHRKQVSRFLMTVCGAPKQVRAIQTEVTFLPLRHRRSSMDPVLAVSAKCRSITLE